MTARDPRDGYEEVSFGSDAQPDSHRRLLAVAAACLVIGLLAAVKLTGPEAESGASSADPVKCVTGYRDGFVSTDPRMWRDQLQYLASHNGQPAARDMALNLTDSIGELAKDDPKCQPLVDFNTHLEDIADLTMAGKRIPRARLRETAAAGDEWLTAINETPVFAI